MGLLLLVALTAAAASCHANIVYPDQLERIRQQYEMGFQLQVPKFEPSNPNDIGSQYNDGGFQLVNPNVQAAQPEATILGQANPLPSSQSRTTLPAASTAPVATKKPTVSAFDTFLPPKWRDHVINVISRGVTKFTLDIDRVIGQLMPASSGNLLFSPASLTGTLAMTMLASNGKTFDEIAKILGLESGVDISRHSEIVHQIFGLLIQESQKMQQLAPNAPQTNFAFGIFVEDGYPVRQQFKDVCEKVYKSDVVNVDFSHHNTEAQATINDWVSRKTSGKIRNMLNDAPSPTTDVIITSALYFSGEWESHFFEGGTKRKPFYIEPDQVTYVDMMYNGGQFPFYEDKKLGAKIVGFPYKGDKVSMYAVLPTAEGAQALKNLKARLTPEIIDGLVNNMTSSLCVIGYPKMKLSSTLHMRQALRALGLQSLFDPMTADLSILSPGRNASQSQPVHAQAQNGFNGGLRPVNKLQSGLDNRSRYCNRRGRRQTRPIDQEFVDFLNKQNLPKFGVDELRHTAGIGNPGLYADDVIHKVEMTVNEKGTEAAAATSVILDRSGDYKRFVANRPFLFFIRDEAARVIWFWGTINKPTPFFAAPSP